MEKLIYLDNSATTFPKPKEVIAAVNDAMVMYGANPGRSGHSFSLKSALKITEIREAVCDFLGAESAENIVFTSGCTEALNLAILGSVRKGGHIICSADSHNSVLRPLFEIQKSGLVDLSMVESSGNRGITADDIKPLIKENTYLVCVNHISNVDGSIADVVGIGKMCAENDLLFLVDGAQSVGHEKINMSKMHIDFLAVAGHKGLYALQGVGVLAYSTRAKPNPIRFGGTGTDSISVEQPLHAPECYESGTLPTPAIISLGAGLNFVRKNFEKIQKKLEDLTTFLHFELSKIDGVKIYTHPENAHGVLAFNIKNIDSATASQILDEKFSIMLRSGLHCAPLKHKSLGTTTQGVLRVSMSYFNSINDIEKLVKAVRAISSTSGDLR